MLTVEMCVWFHGPCSGTKSSLLLCKVTGEMKRVCFTSLRAVSALPCSASREVAATLTSLEVAAELRAGRWVSCTQQPVLGGRWAVCGAGDGLSVPEARVMLPSERSKRLRLT